MAQGVDTTRERRSSIEASPAMIEAGLEAITERWRDWPYGERRVSLMLADVWRSMRAVEIREECVPDVVA